MKRRVVRILDKNSRSRRGRARARRARNCHPSGSRDAKRTSRLDIWVCQMRNCPRFWKSVFVQCETGLLVFSGVLLIH